MAVNKRITELNPLSVATADDLLAIVEMGMSPNETMRITKGNLMNSPGPIGGVNASTGDFSALTLVNQINEFSTDDTLSGDSDTAVPTEKAVKSYVDTEIQNATDNVLRINIVPTTGDSTATVGDVLIVDTTGDSTIDLVPDGNGRIMIIQVGIGTITITSSTGSLYGAFGGGPVETFDSLYSSREVMCIGDDFYII